MTKKMVIPQLKGADWYLTNNFARADLVTDKASNKDLGVEDISFRPIDPGFDGEADVTIRFQYGLSVFARIYKSKNGEHLVLNFREKKNRDEDGKVISSYVYNVRVPLEVQAQVLRHAETFLKEVNETPAPTPDAAVVDAVADVPAKKEAAPEAKKMTKEEILQKTQNMSEEELEAMFAGK